MAEITPIVPSPTVIGVVKVQRDEARKDKPRQPKQDKDGRRQADESEGDGQPSQHIDERV